MSCVWYNHRCTTATKFIPVLLKHACGRSLPSFSSIPPSLPLLLFRSFVRRVISLDLCVAAVSSNGVRLRRRSGSGGSSISGDGGSGERRGHKSSARQKRDPSHRWKGEKRVREERRLSSMVVMVDLRSKSSIYTQFLFKKNSKTV